MLQPAKDPISYEAWKTASYEDVAKEVAPVIIEFHKISDEFIAKLEESIPKGMRARASNEEATLIKARKIRKSSNKMVTMPHLALARLVNLEKREFYPLPFIFTSCSDVNASIERLRAFNITDLPVEIFKYVSAEHIQTSCDMMYAHSERAIFEMLLQDKKVLLGDNDHKYILQIKNSLPMCPNCQDLWLNKSYKNKSGQYAGKFDKKTGAENSSIYIWEQIPYLAKTEAFADIPYSAIKLLRHQVGINYVVEDDQTKVIERKKQKVKKK